MRLGEFPQRGDLRVGGCRAAQDLVDDFTGLHSSTQGVQQQLAAQPLPVQGSIEGESGEEHRRDGVGRAASELRGKIRPDHEVSGEAEVGDDDLVSGMPDERPCRAHRLRMSRVVAEPGVEGVGAGAELVEQAVLGQRL
ncbi:MAG TPA: hypothetical protein VFA46_00205 [Actinomycetes bacterium]|nr:hypothetical protein [Actinomycetes bacterium]